MTYKTLGDVVREHAASEHGGTDDGIRMLDLHDAEPSVRNGAANLYMAALAIIKQQATALSEVTQTLENYKEARQAAAGAANQNAGMFLRERDYAESLKAHVRALIKRLERAGIPVGLWSDIATIERLMMDFATTPEQVAREEARQENEIVPVIQCPGCGTPISREGRERGWCHYCPQEWLDRHAPGEKSLRPKSVLEKTNVKNPSEAAPPGSNGDEAVGAPNPTVAGPGGAGNCVGIGNARCPMCGGAATFTVKLPEGGEVAAADHIEAQRLLRKHQRDWPGEDLSIEVSAATFPSQGNTNGG